MRWSITTWAFYIWEGFKLHQQMKRLHNTVWQRTLRKKPHGEVCHNQENFIGDVVDNKIASSFVQVGINIGSDKLQAGTLMVPFCCVSVDPSMAKINRAISHIQRSVGPKQVLGPSGVDSRAWRSMWQGGKRTSIAEGEDSSYVTLCFQMLLFSAPDILYPSSLAFSPR